MKENRAEEVGRKLFGFGRVLPVGLAYRWHEHLERLNNLPNGVFACGMCTCVNLVCECVYMCVRVVCECVCGVHYCV